MTVHGLDSDFLEEQSQLLLYKNYGEINENVQMQSSLISYINELKENAKPPIYNINTINNNNNIKSNNNKNDNKHLNLIEFHYKNEKEQIYLLLAYGHILSTNEIINRINPININDENVMSSFYNILIDNGYLIRNRWISKSKIHYEGYISMIRDIIIYYFYKNEYIDPQLINHQFYIDSNELNKMLSEFAVYNKEIKKYMLINDVYENYNDNNNPNIIIPETVLKQEEQIIEELYNIRNKEIKEYHEKLHNRELLSKQGNNNKSNESNNKNNGYSINNNTFTFSPLDPLVISIIKQHGGIVKDTDLRQFVSEGKNDPKYASYFVDTFPEDFYNIISFYFNFLKYLYFFNLFYSLSNVTIFVPQSSAYILKKVGNDEIDKYRNIIIQLLLTGNSIQKKVIKEKIKNELKLNLPEHTYSKIMKELPVMQSGIGWTFKTYL